MTPTEIIADTKVPNTKSVFVLGCLESRVTLYAQQVRALNLVDAIIAKGLIRPTGTVAIIGGGAAGITAAAALALAMPDLRAIDIYEQKDDLLHLQLKSRDRYLHPHIYDWPSEGSLHPEAGLPILNWRSGTAEEVAEQILASFDAIRQHTRTTIRTKLANQVERVQAAPHQGCRVFVAGHPHAGDFYDIAILSVGFGYEREIDDERNRSYWDAHPLSSPIRKHGSTHAILVSGNGDGGLVDFLTAAFKWVSHREICEFVTGYPGIDVAVDALREVEERAWSAHAGVVDIYEQYTEHVLRVLPDNLLLDVADRLRPSVRVLFHTRDKQLFRRDTSVLNRFAAFLAITADSNHLRSAIEVVHDAKFATGVMEPIVEFDNGEKIEPSFRFLRFGADTGKNLSPFADHISALRAACGATPPGFRAATPALTDSAKKRFASFSQKFGAASAQSQVATSRRSESKPVQLFLRGLEGDRCEWVSDVLPAEVCQLWRDSSPPPVITCDMPVSTAGALRTIIARLAAHAARYELYCPDPPGWTEFLHRYVDQALPGPDIEVKFAVRRPVVDPPQAAHRATFDRATLAAQVHSALDVEVIDRLHRELHTCLSSPPRRHFGWDLEPVLRSQVLAKWDEWYGQLKINDAQRRRFLVLLSSLNDAARHSEDRLVCIGPRIVKQHLVRSAVLALAFTVAVDDTLAPVGNHPGNLKAASMTAHASGVSWLDGRGLGPDVVSHPWTTGFVLLSELRTPAALIRAGLPRLDRGADAPPRIDDVAVNEQPIILGCDYELQQALSHGRSAVRAYVTDIIRDRAAAAAGLLES